MEKPPICPKDIDPNALPGKGTKDEPYVLCHPNHVKLMGRPPSYALDKYYTLGADIDMQGAARLEPLGSPCVTGADASKRFTGYFDGKHKIIKNYELTGGVKVGSKTYYPEVGFFSCIETGKVKGFANARFEPKKGVCDALPKDYQTNLKKCSASGTVHCSGAKGQPTIVCSRDHLEKIKNALDDSYILTDHIDLQKPTAKTYTGGYIISGDFIGSFNGNGFEIRNLKANVTSGDFGIFENIGSSTTKGTVENLGIRGIDITTSSSSSYTINLLSSNIQGNSSSIKNVYIIDDDDEVDILNNSRGVTSIISSNVSAGVTIANTFTRLKIQEKDIIGSTSNTNGRSGFINIMRGTIQNSYAHVEQMLEGSGGTISVSGFYVGGLVGKGESSSQILNSFSMGSITHTGGKTGSMAAGGLVGYIDRNATSPIIIQNSFSVMKLTGIKQSSASKHERLGGLMGEVSGHSSGLVSIYNSYARGSLDFSSASSSTHPESSHYGGIAGFFTTSRILLKNAYSGTKLLGQVDTRALTLTPFNKISSSGKGGIFGLYWRNTSNAFTNVFFDASSATGSGTAKACGRGADCPAAGGMLTGVTGANNKAALTTAAKTAWATNYPVWKFSGNLTSGEKASIQGGGYPALDLCAGWDTNLAADATTDTDSIIDNDNDPDEARFDINRNGMKESNECVWDQSVHPPRLKIFPADIQPRG